MAAARQLSDELPARPTPANGLRNPRHPTDATRSKIVGSALADIPLKGHTDGGTRKGE
jgi:hypothetical protein